MNSFGKKIERLFQDREVRKDNMSFDFFITILILFSSLIYTLKYYYFNGTSFFFLELLDGFIMVIFTAELLLRNYFSERKFKYFFSIYNLIDLVAIIPFWFGVNSLQFLRVLRILKIFRFFPKYLNSKKLSVKILDRILIFKMISIFFVFVFVSSSFILYIEGEVNESINTFDDALYFSLVTATTVGYGDITPVTRVGKIIVGAMVVFGVLLIPVYIASLMRMFLKNREGKITACPKCNYKRHDLNASNCKMCGEVLRFKE